MTNTQPQWRRYQEQVAEALSRLGLASNVDERIEGARGVHAVDVTARTTSAGVPQLWVVECKLWKRRIPKERALTFIGIAQDVGADRGFIFSESGFQTGAVSVTRNTNVTLTSLSDFQQCSAPEVAALRVRTLNERAATLVQKFLAIWDENDADRSNILGRYVGPPSRWGPPHDGTTVTSRLSALRQSLEDATFGRWPVTYFPLDDDDFFTISDWDNLLFAVEETISTCERIYDHMMSTNTGTSDWKEFQSPELTKRLATARARAIR